MGTQEAGTRHHLGAHQHGRNNQRESVLHGDAHRQLEQSKLQQRAGAGQEGEPRPGHLGTAFHVDEAQRLAQLEVVSGVVDDRWLTHSVQHDEIVFATRGYAADDDI